MTDETIIVTTENNGPLVVSMWRVKIRYELPDFEGALAAVDYDSDNPIYGQINYVDLKALDEFSWDNDINIRTGELDVNGILRTMAEVLEEYRLAQQAKKVHQELKRLHEE